MIKEIYKNTKIRLYIFGFIAIILGFMSYNYIQGSNYIFSETEDRIYNTLRTAGYSKAGACGILGNIAVENSSFEADLNGNGGITYGLFQWNNVGERKQNLVTWCNNRSLYPNRIDGQLAFAIHELEGGDPIAKRLERFLKSTNDPSDAAMEFTVGFERCVGSTKNPEIDARYEGSIYPEYYGKTDQAMAKRMEMAEKYYQGYAGYDNPSLVFKIDATPTPGLVSEIEEKIHIDIQRSLDMNVDATLANDSTRLAILRLVCVAVGYLCGCIYLSMLFIDKKKIRAHQLKNLKEIPHVRSVLAHFGIEKAAYVLLSDIFKLCFAIALTVVFVKDLSLDDKLLFTGLGAIIGNAFPFWNKFKGGIGLTVTILTLILYMPIWGVLCCIIGVYSAVNLKSLTVGVTIMSIIMIPFTYHYKGIMEGMVVTAIVILLIVSHQRILLRYFDRKVLRAHYSRLREM